jgi:hypothetical protein
MYRYTKTKLNRDPKSQAGVTLLLALMIMAALIAIVFSISSITINELNNANTEINSEPAIAGAEAGAETLLYQDNRGSISCSASPSTYKLQTSNVYVVSSNTLYNINPYTFSLGISPSNEMDFDLYNPCDPNGAPGYTSISIIPTSIDSTIPSSTLYICSWSVSPCSPSTYDIYHVSFNTAMTYNSLDANTKYQIVLLNNDTSQVSYSVSTTPSNIGIPASQIVILTTGTNNGVSRKLQTILPK